MTSLLLIQRVIPHYRIALFEELHRRTGARVVVGDTAPSGTFLHYSDPRDYKWALPAPFRFPNSRNAFQAEVPLDFILDTYKPRSIIAEFGVRISSTHHLPNARSRGRLHSFAFWSHGWQMERGFSKPQDLLIQHSRLFLMAKADALGTYSEEGATWLRHRLPKIPVITLGNALDPDAIHRAAKGAVPFPGGSPQLLAVGRLTADKRFDKLIAIFQRVRDTHPRAALTVIGDGPERERLETLASAGANSGITFTGALHTETDLARHFVAADLMIIPGAAGLAVNHALAYRLPIIAFGRIQGGPFHHPEIEYVVDGVSGFLVRTPDDDAMSQRIMEVITSGEAARVKAILAEHSPAPTIADVAENFEKLFRLLDSSPGEYGPPETSTQGRGSDKPLGKQRNCCE